MHSAHFDVDGSGGISDLSINDSGPIGLDFVAVSAGAAVNMGVRKGFAECRAQKEEMLHKAMWFVSSTMGERILRYGHTNLQDMDDTKEADHTSLQDMDEAKKKKSHTSSSSFLTVPTSPTSSFLAGPNRSRSVGLYAVALDRVLLLARRHWLGWGPLVQVFKPPRQP